MTCDLASLLSPLDSLEFLEKCWSRDFRHVPGWAGKFRDLLPWGSLNEILEQHRLDPPRLRLTREGKAVAPNSFVSHQANRRKSGQPIPRLDAVGLQHELRSGATLVLDAVDELHRPVRDLAEELERVFHVRIQVNLYAGWRTSQGFDLHWDDHDVFIVQVAGRKNWKVYGMTRKYPLARDVGPAADPPKEPLWDGLLQDGDLLYIPRGWWHVATPLDEPTLHLTVGVNNPTGADVLSWFLDRLRVSDDVRRDIPLFGGAKEKHAWFESMRDLLSREWRPDLLSEYVEHLDSRATPRPRLALPWAATSDVLPPDGMAFRVKWAGPRQAKFAANDVEVVTVAHGRRWRFAAAASPLLKELAQRPCSLEELHAAAGGALDRNTIRAFVRELALDGLVIVTAGEARAGA
jgi:hypothetical protein